jgi:hypothetical protein
MKELRRLLFIYYENIKYLLKLKFNKLKYEFFKLFNIS